LIPFPFFVARPSAFPLFLSFPLSGFLSLFLFSFSFSFLFVLSFPSFFAASYPAGIKMLSLLAFKGPVLVLAHL